jgi:hypothetical protein
MANDQPSTDLAVPDPKAAPDDPLHTPGGAPTNAAHAAVGDGTLTGSVPAGLTPEEMEAIANDDQRAEGGTS